MSELAQEKHLHTSFEVEATADQLKTVEELACEQIRLECEVDTAERALKELKQQLTKIEQGLLPDALYAAGLSEIRTVNGDKVTIKEDLSISVPKDKKETIVAWLESEGHDGIVSGRIYVDLPKNSHNERQAAIQALVDAGLEPVEDITFNSATLKSILKDHLRKGDHLELSDFGAFAWKKAVIKRV